MEGFERYLELAANLAELLAGLVILFSVIKVWPFFASLARSQVRKQDYTAELTDLQRDLAQLRPCGRINNEQDAVREILRTSCRVGGSDIHMDLYAEADELKGRIRFRREGTMSTVSTYPQRLHPALITAFKQQAGMDAATGGVQSGRIQEVMEGRSHPIDFRVGIAPANLGDVVTVRILDPRAARLEFDALGIPENSLQRLHAILPEPRGLIVFSGPIGSGKTVSLYASINSLNTESRKVMSIEDPLEVELPRVTQLPVLDAPGHRFSDLFSAAMRADTDVLMIGEIRNEETARACALAHDAGTLVLTTMNAHTVIDALEKLYRFHAEIDFFNVMIMNQRLARRLCNDCATPRTLSAEEETWLRNIVQYNDEDVETLPTKYLQANGCGNCEAGYRGRVGGYETLAVTRDMLQLLQQGQPTEALWRLAIADGTRTTPYNLVTKLARGQTAVEELKRVLDETYYV